MLKDVRLNSADFFIMKIPNKKELQQITLNHSSDIGFKDFIKIYKNVLQNHILFLVNDTTDHQTKLISMNILLVKKYKYYHQKK